MQLSGNTIFITGGTSGIGLGLAERFHAEDNAVIIAGRRERLLSSITAAHPGMESVVLDVTDPDSIRRSAPSVTAEHPDLNMVINTAGIMLEEDLTDPGHLLPIMPTYCTTKAAIHSYTESLRVQLADTGGKVLELIPPGVQTDLMGQAARGQEMPLPAFLTEVRDILRTDPDAVEVCVHDVLFMREAEAQGRHDDVLAMMSGAH